MSLVIAYSSHMIRTATHWEALRTNNKAWVNLTYRGLGESCYGDQIAEAFNTPIPCGDGKIYILGPDIAGPRKGPSYWPENLLCIASSVAEWESRLLRYGDEYAVAPGCIETEDKLEGLREGYREHYRKLNPGLDW